MLGSLSTVYFYARGEDEAGKTRTPTMVTLNTTTDATRRNESTQPQPQVAGLMLNRQQIDQHNYRPFGQLRAQLEHVSRFLSPLLHALTTT